MAKLIAPEGACSFSFEGESYEVTKGTVEIPDQAVADALAHGFAWPEAKTEKAGGKKANKQPEGDQTDNGEQAPTGEQPPAGEQAPQE